MYGEFFNRESFGGYTDSLFAMQIPADIVHPGQITETIEEHLVTVGDVSYIQVHPLFLYESLWCLLLFLVLLVYTRRKTYQGEVFLRYLAGLGLGGAGIEWLRTDALKIPGTDFPVFLPVCALLFLICGVSATVRRVLWKKREAGRRRRREERYAAEGKATLNYNDMQGYENVAGEFWDTDNTAEDTKMPERLQNLRKIRKNLRKMQERIPEAVKKTSLRMQKIRRNTISLQRKIKRLRKPMKKFLKMAEMPGKIRRTACRIQKTAWWKQKKKQHLYHRIERTRKKLNRMAGKRRNLGKCLKVSRQLDEMMNQIQFE